MYMSGSYHLISQAGLSLCIFEVERVSDCQSRWEFSGLLVHAAQVPHTVKLILCGLHSVEGRASARAPGTMLCQLAVTRGRAADNTRVWTIHNRTILN